MSAVPEQQTEPTTRSRRAILAGALGGVGAWAVAAIGGRSRARAADDDPVLVGNYHEATSTTVLSNSSNTNGVFYALSTGIGTAVYAYSPVGHGVNGQTDGGNGVWGQAQDDGTGVYGSSLMGVGIRGETSTGSVGVMGGTGGGDAPRTGVLGYTGGDIPDSRPETGVYGFGAVSGNSRGVIGESPAGQAVRGETESGIALYGTAPAGYALRTDGRIRADRVSGLATIPAGSTGVTVSPGVNVVSSSFVLLTPKTNIGSRALWFTTNASADTFTIKMSSTRSSSTKVAWLLLG